MWKWCWYALFFSFYYSVNLFKICYEIAHRTQFDELFHLHYMCLTHIMKKFNFWPNLMSQFGRVKSPVFRRQLQHFFSWIHLRQEPLMQMPPPNCNHRKRYALQTVQSANADHAGFSRFPKPPASAGGVSLVIKYLDIIQAYAREFKKLDMNCEITLMTYSKYPILYIFNHMSLI